MRLVPQSSRLNGNGLVRQPPKKKKEISNLGPLIQSTPLATGRRPPCSARIRPWLAMALYGQSAIHANMVMEYYGVPYTTDWKLETLTPNGYV